MWMHMELPNTFKWMLHPSQAMRWSSLFLNFNSTYQACRVPIIGTKYRYLSDANYTPIFMKITTKHLSTCITFTFSRHTITTAAKPMDFCLNNTTSSDLFCIPYPCSRRTIQDYGICLTYQPHPPHHIQKHSPRNTLWATHQTNLLNLKSLQQWTQSSYPLYQFRWCQSCWLHPGHHNQLSV